MSDNPRRPGDDSSPSINLHRTEPPEARANEKRELVSQLLEHGKVLVRVEARRPGVQVPTQFASEFALPLNLSWGFRDTAMVINDSGIAATLRFSGKAFRCVLPWASIWGITLVSSGAFQVWKPDVPPEIDAAPALNDAEEPAPAKPIRPKLSVVHSVPAPAEPPAADSEPMPSPEPATPEATSEASVDSTPPQPRAPWLRLVR